MIDRDQDAQQISLPHLDLPLGLRLRRGREAAGMSVAETAEKLRLKLAIVEAMEREDVKALGASVYVRGYYTSYARLLGIPQAVVDAGLAPVELQVAPALHTTTRVSHGRYLFDRYARRAVYVVLTASIVVPLILIATSERLPDRGALIKSIDDPMDLPEATRVARGPADSAAVASADDAFVGPPTPDAAALARAATVDAETDGSNEIPALASMTPFYSQTRTPDAPVAAPPFANGTVVAADGMSLQFSADSWVEITGHDGSRLAYGLMRAGESRSFDPASVARVSLGNAGAVELRMNGAVMDIAPYRRANVARFTVSSDGSLAPAGG